MSPEPTGRIPDNRRGAVPNRAVRADKALGRRKTDYLPRTTITRKLLVIVVAAVNAVYLVADAFLGTNVCP